MALEARLLAGLALALSVVYCATPIAIRVADRLHFYDHPVGYKGHAAPTPYLGGAAVVGGFLLALVALTGDWQRTLPVAGGVLLLCAVGTLDDRGHLAPLERVAVEVTLGVLLWRLGLGWDLGFGTGLDLAATCFWVVAVVNAFNLFDNMDGATSSMAGVVAAMLALVGLIEGDAWLAVASAALCGACLGFLPHNLLVSPARIFLGDGGSLPIGFAVAALAMAGAREATAEWQSLAMGLLFVGIPALDTALVVISRRRRGISVLTGGRDHLTHRTHVRMRSAKAVAVTLGAAQALVSALAIMALEGGSAAVVLLVLLYVTGVGVTVAVLDRGQEPLTAGGHPGAAALGSGRSGAPAPVAAAALLAVFAIALGLSPFARGFYESAVWAPAGLGVLAVVTAVALARPVRTERRAKLTLAAVAALGVWALLSSLWADSVEQAVAGGNRVLVYALVLGGLLLLMRTPRLAAVALAALAATGVLVAAVVTVRMLAGDASVLFLGGRLDGPLGYVNGQAACFLLALWPCVAAAEQRKSALLAGAAAGGATLLGCVVLLSQSRGAALAAVGSAAVVLALVPGRLLRAWLLLLITGGVALAAPALLDVYELAAGAAAPEDALRTAGRGALLAALGVGAVWGAMTAVPAPASRRVGAAAGAALAVLAAAVLAAGAANAGAIAGDLERQYDAFVQLDAGPAGAPEEEPTRLVSGAGNRYDYWRVAVTAWRDRPLAGYGSGNYDRPYFQWRRTSEDVRQPHSLELQVASELGLVGIGLLALAVAGVGWGAARWGRAARAPGLTRVLAVGATGIGAAWLLHASVDWTHLLPGVTGAALVAAAVLLMPVGGARATPARTSRRGRLLPAVAAGVILALAGASLSRQTMSEHFLRTAAGAIAEDPAAALRDADRTLRLDPEALGAYHIKAAALARFGEAEAATAALREGARREPGDFVTWALLGDLSVRRGQLGRAAGHYRRALALNPGDPSLRELARDPRAALSGPGR